MNDFLVKKLHLDPDHVHHESHHKHVNHHLHSLNEFIAGLTLSIAENLDQKSIALGFCEGAKIRIIENDVKLASMLIEINGTRHYILKVDAEQIKVE